MLPGVTGLSGGAGPHDNAAFPLPAPDMLLTRLLITLAVLAGVAPVHGEEAPKAALEEARKASAELVTSVRSELVKAIEASGPLRAIVVCKYTVPEIASAVSRKYGARVTRVSLSPRNPSLGWGDAWEQSVLMGFEERVAKGEKGEGMEHFDVVNEPSGKFLRYMRVLPMMPVCSHCHGPADQISEPIRSQLAHDYPHDKAIGVAVGKVRGAVTFKKPL